MHIIAPPLPAVEAEAAAEYFRARRAEGVLVALTPPLRIMDWREVAGDHGL